MDFDEYEYLEKTVQNQDDRENSSKSKKIKDGGSEKIEKSYRKRYVDEDVDGENRRSKKSRGGDEENGSRKERDRDDKDRSSRRDKDRRRSSREGDREREGEREKEKDRDRERSSRDKDRESEKDKDKERRDRDRDKDREKERRDGDKENDREEREREGSRSRRSRSHSHRSRSPPRRSSSRSRRSSSRSRRHDIDFDRERDFEFWARRRPKEKKEAGEPEADPERDQRTVFAYQMPLKATERDVFEFFSKAGKVSDVKLIMDRNSRRSKGVGYIEFCDVMSVPMAIALSGQLLLGQPVMVKPSEAEKNLVPSTAASGASVGVAGAYGAPDRKLYVGNLHFNMTESQLKSIFEAFGPVEVVQLPVDPETSHCKGFGFVQFAQLEHAKAAQSVNGKLEIAGRFLKISSVTDHVGPQDTTAKSADLDDDEGGLALNARSRAELMAKLDRTGIATSIVGSLGGVPGVNGAPPNQPGVSVLPVNMLPASVPIPVLPRQVFPAVVEVVGNPTECLLLKNLFDPTAENDPEFDLEIKEDVEGECSKYGRVVHIYVDRNSAGYVYLRLESVAAAINVQRAMHMRWFAARCISAIFMQPYEYEAKFKGSA